MTLPDTLERIGIVVGSTLLLALPTSALFSLLYGVGESARLAPSLWLLPGLLVGVLVATDRLAVTYHQLWKFSLASYVVASLGGASLGLDGASGDLALAVGWWVVSVGVGSLVARTQFRALVGDSAG